MGKAPVRAAAPAAPPEPANVREALRDNAAFGSGDVRQLQQILSGPQVQEVRREIVQLQAEIESTRSPDANLLVRAGISSYLLAQHQRAIDYLLRVPNNGTSSFYRALSLMSLERYTEAEEAFEDAVKHGFDKVEATLRRAGAVRMQGRLAEAEQLVRSVAKEGAGRAEYSYQMGCIYADQGDSERAVEYFERAVDMQPSHSRALFRLAAENALRGNDDEAVRLYEQSLSKPPLHMGALLNLGLLYEDRENYPAAAFCFRRILEVDPTHQRARLYLKDIEATDQMYYDEESARYAARMEQLLSRPVTDFELSVRSRNCLAAMNIFTLGDLTRVNEQELLAGKNFGETSLQEIREMLTAHGLRIGQNQHQARPAEFAFSFTPTLSPQEQATLSKPISELNLSVRARKCMTRLGITTVGELVHRTPDELLASRNFGVTSLNEIRGKLAEIGLSLRND